MNISESQTKPNLLFISGLSHQSILTTSRKLQNLTGVRSVSSPPLSSEIHVTCQRGRREDVKHKIEGLLQ